jgi:hypothetical protein
MMAGDTSVAAFLLRSGGEAASSGTGAGLPGSFGAGVAAG